MVTKLTKLGNGLGVIIDKPMLELLNISLETSLEMTTDGARIILTPVRRDRDRARGVGQKVMREQADTLRKLAK